MDSRAVRMVDWTTSPRMAVSMRGHVRRVKSGEEVEAGSSKVGDSKDGAGGEDTEVEEVFRNVDVVDDGIQTFKQLRTAVPAPAKVPRSSGKSCVTASSSSPSSSEILASGIIIPTLDTKSTATST